MPPSLGGGSRGRKESGGANKIHTSQFKAPSSGSPTMQRLSLSLSHMHCIFNFLSHFTLLSSIDGVFLQSLKWHGISFFHLTQILKWSHVATDDMTSKGV